MPDPTAFRSTPPNFAIRDAKLEDMTAVAAIYGHYVQSSAATFEEILPSPDEMVCRFSDLTDKGLPYLVAEQENEVAGYAYAGPYRDRSGYRFTVEDSVYVNNDCLGLGIGRGLLAELIGRCTTLGYRQMVAVIGDSANAASIALHSQLGFKVIGSLPSSGRKFDRWVDTVLMQRSLGKGSATPP